MIQSDDAPRQIAWTNEEEIVMAKGWVAVLENNKYGNARKEHGFWCEESGASDDDYINMALIHYQAETGNTFKYCHCWEVLKDSPKWKETEHPKFATKSERGSKKQKSSGSSSFNTESRDASINMNTNAGDNNKDEVQKIRRTMGRDKARAAGKNKGPKA
ncbi:ALP1-like protein, partial [Tanacetum coccineum]